MATARPLSDRRPRTTHQIPLSFTRAETSEKLGVDPKESVEDTEQHPDKAGETLPDPTVAEDPTPGDEADSDAMQGVDPVTTPSTPISTPDPSAPEDEDLLEDSARDDIQSDVEKAPSFLDTYRAEMGVKIDKPETGPAGAPDDDKDDDDLEGPEPEETMDAGEPSADVKVGPE